MKGSETHTIYLVSYPNQIHQKWRFEHPVETHFIIHEKILQTASGAVLSHNAKDPGVEEKPQVQI